MPTMIKLTCDFCQQSFEKELRYHKRNIKRGNRGSFCSQSCASKFRILKNPALPKNITPGRELDQFSPFRKYHYSAKARSKAKHIRFTLKLQHLLDQWNRQEGKCALSGITMTLPEKSGDSLNRSPFMASLDRIKPKLGYVPNNIQWVCLIGQFAKNEFDEEPLFQFCHAYCEHQTQVTGGN